VVLRLGYEARPGHNSPALHYFRGPYINLSFQDGPIQEHGVNGTTNEEIIQLLIDRITSLNTMYDGRYACDEVAEAIKALLDAKEYLEARTKARVERGVEGTNVP
jgi:hypothetical protein